MFDRGDNAALGPDDGGQAGIHHVIEMGGDRWMTGKIGADKSDSLVDRCGLDGEVNDFAGMDANAGTASRRLDGLLVAIHFLYILTLGDPSERKFFVRGSGRCIHMRILRIHLFSCPAILIICFYFDNI
jgi:hypothetical protein